MNTVKYNNLLLTNYLFQAFHVRSGTKSREMAKHMVSTEQQDSQ